MKKIVCTNCGQKLNIRQQFCKNCGQKKENPLENNVIKNESKDFSCIHKKRDIFVFASLSVCILFIVFISSLLWIEHRKLENIKSENKPTLSVSSSTSEKNTNKSASKPYTIIYMTNSDGSNKTAIAAGYGIYVSTSNNTYVDVKDSEGQYYAQISDFPKDKKIEKKEFGSGNKNITLKVNGSLISSGENLILTTQGLNYYDVRNAEGEYVSQNVSWTSDQKSSIEVK